VKDARRHNVTIQYNNATAGSDDPSYATFVANVPCKITPVSGGEQYRGRQIEATVTHLIEMRFLSGLSPTMRLYQAIGTKYYNIQRIFEVDGKRHDVDIMATEVVA